MTPVTSPATLRAARVHPDWDDADWPHRERSAFVEAGGLVWHVQVMGHGPALLLVHGTGSATHTWRDLAPILARRFRVIAPDLPGHGFSGWPADGDFSMRAFATGLHRLLSVLGARARFAAGHSAGAAVLVRMAMEGQLSPRALVSINGAFLPWSGLPGLVFEPLARVATRLPLVPRLVARQARQEGFVRRLIEGTGSSLDARGTALYARMAADPARVDAALRMMSQWDLPAFAEGLSGWRGPLHLVAGENDRTVPAWQAQAVARRVGGASVEILPRLGHLAHEEAPRLVAARLLRVFRRAMPASGEDE
jgi:putative magnesium chelatase accessory protein